MPTLDYDEIRARHPKGKCTPRQCLSDDVDCDAIQLLDEVERLTALTEDIAASHDGLETVVVWQNKEITRLREALKTYPWEWVRAISTIDDGLLREWLAKRSKALAVAEKP